MQHWLRNRTRAGTRARLTPKLIHLEPTQWLKHPVQAQLGGVVEVDPKLGEGREGKGGNVTSHLSKFPTAFPCTGVLLAPSGCQERGIAGTGKVVSTNSWFFPSCFPPKRWGCLEGNTSYFPASHVQTTKSPSRSQTGSLREHV